MKFSIYRRFWAACALLAINSVTAVAAEQATQAGENAVSGGMDYVATLFVFMLATFIGIEVIRRVSRLLHTPLMSLTNAISAIAVVGSILIAGQHHSDYKFNILGLVAIAASVCNIVSGFLITDRMLKMFKKREGSK